MPKSKLRIFAQHALSERVTVEEAHNALREWMEVNRDKIEFVRDIDTDSKAWCDPQEERDFCVDITHDATLHEMEFVGILPVVGYDKGWLDIVVFMHRSSPSEEWALCFVWHDTKSLHRRKQASRPSEVSHVVGAFARMPSELAL